MLCGGGLEVGDDLASDSVLKKEHTLAACHLNSGFLTVGFDALPRRIGLKQRRFERIKTKVNAGRP